MTPHVFIRHLVRVSCPTLHEQHGTREVLVNDVANAFERDFFCGFINGHQYKWNRKSVVRAWRVNRQVDQDGDIKDEIVQEVTL